MTWKHIDFYFNTKYKKEDKYLNPKEQVMFERCVANIITDLRPFIKRKFYLYEPKPHCFLALEINNLETFLPNNVIKRHTRDCDFIKSANLNLKSGKDETNGEDFLTILDAFTEAYLFKRKSRLTHIVHCAMEFIHQTRAKELNFYEQMLSLYGGEEYR